MNMELQDKKFQDMELQDMAHKIRTDILRMFYISKTGHLAPALSCVDIFTALYFEPVINWEKRFTEDRDRVILSKGHACAALYAVLAYAGYFQREELFTFYQNHTRLGGHPHIALPGIETATGSLGHGICFGTGTALAAKTDGRPYRTYVILGDGESQEGSVWEAAMFAGNHGLGNLTVIMDHNGLQASDRVDNIASVSLYEEKWRAFNWHVLHVNGHDFTQLSRAFSEAKEYKSGPSIIIADTVKGKGISIAEDSAQWHSRTPQDHEWETVCKDLNISFEEMRAV